jgi:DNA polymerase III alpha subunit
MIHLRLHTEFSFRRAYGRVEDVLKVAGGAAAAITDYGTWGHVAWSKACKKAGVRPIFGAEISVVADARVREKQPAAGVCLLARDAAGLEELYGLVSRANGPDCFYYFPRLDYRDINAISEHVYVLAGPGTLMDRLAVRQTTYLMLTPTNASWNRRSMANSAFPKVVCCDNIFPLPDDQAVYEILAQRDKVTRATAMHILDEDALRLAVPEADDECFLNTERIASDCKAVLPVAENIRIDSDKTLYELCIEGARARGMDVKEYDRTDSFNFILADATYQARLDHELELIYAKRFEHYFYLVGDMVRWAKSKMLVGPARGSAAGSLVCYLLGITDVDPLVHDLMFERFIDVTRADLPDVDIDFQDDRRDLVIGYLRDRYGVERVGRIGTVARLKAKSCLGDVAREMNIPPWEIQAVQDAMIERSSGDARAQFCVQDALETLDVGKQLVAKYPGIVIAGKLENHAQHTGKHAAGVIVAQHPVTKYCSLDNSGAAQIDKKDAESLNMLKIDALGLRTLSIIQDTLDQIRKTRDWLVTYPLDDTEAFEVLNAERYSGIFQFEGYALQSLCRQMKVRTFDDLQVIGALARPGPLHCGAATDFIQRRIGEQPISHMHPATEPITKSTYGIIIYQEQVISIARIIGNLSWEDTTELRKAMSKTLGDEFFNQYWEKFEAGAKKLHKMPSSEARRIWDKMCTFGSWAFNKSHSVSYGIISYWCCVLKAHHPLEFAAACLRNAKDTEQGIRILRDLSKEGFHYKPVDPAKSGITWEVVDGVLMGGLTNIKGIGEKTAADIIRRRQEGRPQLPGKRKLLSEPRTPYDDIFEGDRRFGDYYRNPRAHGIVSGPVSHICDVNDPGDYVIIAKLKVKNLRDMNEYGSVVKRGGKIMKKDPLFLNLDLEDDTGAIKARIGRFDYKKWGKTLVELAREDEWFIWKCHLKDDGWRVLTVERWRCLEENHPLNKVKEKKP